jgi:hypothetical protein
VQHHDTPILDLRRLGEGFPCLSPESGSRLAHAAAICLEERKHPIGVMMGVTGYCVTSFSLIWPETSEHLRREWSDPREATECGATGIAILLVCALTDYQVVQRSWKGTGFDYWLGLQADFMLQKAARLEVSGMRMADSKKVEARLRQKLKQTERSRNTGLPAIVVVVEFGKPTAMWMTK